MKLPEVAFIKKHYRNARIYTGRRSFISGAAFVAALAVIFIGTLLLRSSSAVTSVASVQSESGTRSAKATLVTDSSASGGSAVKFSGGGTSACPSSVQNAVDSADPWGGCWPGPLTTGVPSGTVLKTAVNATGTGYHGDAAGNIILTANNVTVDSYLIQGRLDPGQFTGFTLKNSKVQCIGEDSWCVVMTNNSTLQDVEIGGRGCTATQLAQHQTVCYSYAAAIWTGPSTTGVVNKIIRANIYGTTRAVQMDGQTTVQDSYFHDSVFDCAIRSGTTSCGNHSSASFMSKGHAIKYLHNSLMDGSSAVLFGQCYDVGATLGDVTIDRNRIIATVEPNGWTSSFGISIENKQLDQPNTIRITNNVFDSGPWDVSPWRDDGIGYTITGNTVLP